MLAMDSSTSSRFLSCQKGSACASDCLSSRVNKTGTFFRDVFHITEESVYILCAHARTGAINVGNYIREHWKILTIYTVAWALIITSCGILYGFKRTALPLTIGMSAGIGVGITTAILTTKVFDPQAKYRGTNTVVGWFAHKSLVVDPTTKQIALTILIAVYLAACIKFPHATGGLTGLVVGNFVGVQFSEPKLIKPEKHEIRQEPATLEKIREEIHKLRQELNLLKGVEDDGK